MINARPALDHLDISSTSVIHAVQQVREFVERDGPDSTVSHSIWLIDKLIGVELQPAMFANRPVTNDRTYAMQTAQAVVELLLKSDCSVDDPGKLLEDAHKRVDAFVTKPSNKWLFAVAVKDEGAVTEVAVAQGIETKVAIKADGTIKKGGREILAAELWKKHVLCDTPVDNQGFIKILMTQLGMTKSGATTYAWNMKKKFGAPEGFTKQRGAKS